MTMTRYGWLSIAVILAVLSLITVQRVGFPSGWVSAANGLGVVGKDVALRQDCATNEFLQWDGSLWPCSNTLTSPTIQTSPTAAGATWTDLGTATTADINGGTWTGTIDGASTVTADLTLADNVAAAWGTGGDSTILYDGTDTIWDLQAVSTNGGLTIGLANSVPTPDTNTVSIWAGSAGTVAAPSNTTFVIEDDKNTGLALLNPAANIGVIYFGTPTANNRGQIAYFGPSATPSDTFRLITGGAGRLDYAAGAFQFLEATTVSSSAGDITVDPTANLDVSSDPLLIQNVSQTTAPGTTVDGQIRLWQDSDAGGVDGRIVFQVGGTTYQVNADAGLTFLNNPDILARDIALFTVGFEQWQIDRAQQADDEFVAFDTLWPAIGLVRLAPSFSQAYLNHLNTQYAIADAYFIANSLDEGETPLVPTVPEIKAENPWPNPATYTVPDATINETVGFRSGDNMVVGDPVVMVVDRLKFNASEGENWGVHMVPSTLTDEFLWLLDNDAAFLASVKTKLGIP